jgi:hypothetical protein
VVGGFVYRGDALRWLRGRYVFGEFSGPDGSGRLFFMNASGRIREFQLRGQDSLGFNVDGFGQDADGELYVMGNTTGTPFGATGVVFRLGA